MLALIVCFFIIKDKERAPRRRWTCTDFSSVAEASPSKGKTSPQNRNNKIASSAEKASSQ
ncbi:hypothetical protein HDC90_004862 [Pedobacter sp. AK013]|nr:hypothetical protein [Pedobacter sp. AK013]